MSTLALMRWLESSPERYDAGMRVLSFGRVARLHKAAANAALTQPGARVLEVGCGTGSVTRQLLERGATVTALDQSAEMLEAAQRRIGSDTPGVTWLERSASEIDALDAGAFDRVLLCLCLSDMSRDERRYVLRASAERIRPGGRLVVADETRPRRVWQRALQALGRGPQWLAAWLLTGAVSRPVTRLREEFEASGFRVEMEERWLYGTLAILVSAPKEDAPRGSDA